MSDSLIKGPGAPPERYYPTPDSGLASAFARHPGRPLTDLSLSDLDETIVKLLPQKIVEKYLVIPIARVNRTLTLAMVDPANIAAIDEIRFSAEFEIETVAISLETFQQAFQRFFRPPRELELRGEGDFSSDIAVVEADDDDVIDLEDQEVNYSAAPVVKLVNIILLDALRRSASDIHIEPYERELRVRMRIDGILYEILQPPNSMRNSITSRIKILAKLDISEKRLPQDGRIKLKLKLDNRTRELDYRVSTLPTLWGEKIVLRLLDREKLMLDMTGLGFEPESLARFKRQIAKPYGMVLVTGPTGSGKTNTLYSALASLNTSQTNIMTIEDPVEFNLPGINQVQVKEQIGLNFAAALRAFLRQDPNIILVGEIRDFETAEIAVKAALTGHLVLSTLHTNDAPATVSRLMNMGVEPFLIANSVNLIQAQRLIRRICKECREEVTLPKQSLIEVGFSPEQADEVRSYRGSGCAACNNTGYKGRVGLYEVMEITDEIRELILVGASALELRRRAIEDGMITLRQSGLRKIIASTTTIEEVVRETVK